MKGLNDAVNQVYLVIRVREKERSTLDKNDMMTFVTKRIQCQGGHSMSVVSEASSWIIGRVIANKYSTDWPNIGQTDRSTVKYRLIILLTNRPTKCRNSGYKFHVNENDTVQTRDALSKCSAHNKPIYILYFLPRIANCGLIPQPNGYPFQLFCGFSCVALSACLTVFLSVFLAVCLSLSVCPSSCLPIWLFSACCLSLCLSVRLFISLSEYDFGA